MAVAGLGIFLAYAVYQAKWLSSDNIARVFGPAYHWAYNKYYFDYLYEDLFVKKFLMGKVFAGLQKVDTYVVDGAVNGLATITVGTGKAVRRWQTGQLQLYGLFIGIGVIVIAVVVLVFG